MGYLCAKIYTLAFYPSNSLFGVDMALIVLGSAVMLLNTNAHPYIQAGKFSFQVGQLLCHLFVPEFHVVVIRVHCKWRLSDGPECLFSNVRRAFQRSHSKVVRQTFSNVDSGSTSGAWFCLHRRCLDPLAGAEPGHTSGSGCAAGQWAQV
jgi:hypothetical protein